MELLFGLFACVVVITLLGHGFWVLIRTIVRGLAWLFGGKADPPIEAEMCPRCGEAWDRRIGTGQCSLCGWPAEVMGRLHASTAQIMLRLRRRVERYHQLGLLSKEVQDRLIQAFQVEAGPPILLSEKPKPDVAPTIQPAPIATVGPVDVRWVEPLAPAADVAARARAYRAAHETRPEPASEAEAIPSLSQTVPTGRQSQQILALLATFLEEKNIRWGELVGGLLIVGCSLALVISFWSSIAERPFLKFGLFNGVTALLFALGHHAERRWRLPTTALGLLAIATLLTPLNFLAVASLARGATGRSAWGIAGELVVVGLFAAFTRRAGRSLVIRVPTALMAGVLVPSITLLLIRRVVSPGGGSSALLTLGAVPLVAQVGAIGWVIFRVRRDREIEESSALDLLRLLGLTTFAVAVAEGLLIARAGPIATALHRVAPLLPLAGMPALASGLVLWRRTIARELVTYRTAGAAIASAGAFGMLAGVALAWPDPSGMIPVALVNFAVMTAVALLFEVPAAHALAGACLALAYWLGWQVATGRLGWTVATSDELAGALLSARSGAVLVPIALLFGGATAAGIRVGRRLDAQAHAVVAVLATTISLGLVTWYGFGLPGDRAGASWVYAVYAVALLVSAGWFGRYPLVEGTDGKAETMVLAWAGSVVILAGWVQRLVYGGRVPGLTWPWIAAMLCHATLTTVAASRVWNRHPNGAIVRAILTRSALATSTVAAGLLVAVMPVAISSTVAVRMLWLAIVWLVLAWRIASPALFGAFQGAMAGAVVFGVATVLGRRDWYASSPLPWLDPWTIQAQSLAMGGLCLAWIGVRAGVRAWGGSAARMLVDPPWPPIDRFLRGAVLLGLVALAVYGVVPGAAQELTPRDLASRILHLPAMAPRRVVPPVSAFEFAGVPHGHALGGGSWAVMAVVVAVLLAGQWERVRLVDLLGALLAATLAAPLMAGRWEPQVAAASAMRWAGALGLLAGSGLIWGRGWLSGWADRLGWRFEPGHAEVLTLSATTMVMILAMLPLAAMGFYVSFAAMEGRTLDPILATRVSQVAILFVVLGGSGVVLRFVPDPPRAWVRPGGALLSLLGTLPLVAVVVYVIGSALKGNPIVGPAPGSAFARLGNAGSFVPPILVVATTLVGYAVRERSSGFAFGAGLVLALAATVGYLLAGVGGGLAFDAELATRLAQLNAVVASGYTLAWMGSASVWRRRRGEMGPAAADGFLDILIILGIALNLLVLIAGTVTLLFDPIPAPAHLAIAGPMGWAALILAAGSVALRARVMGRPVGANWMGLGVLAAANFLALGLARRDPGNWFTYHGILTGQAMAGAVLLVIVWPRLATATDDLRAAVGRWVSVALVVIVLFAVRGYWSDPQSPWWTVGGLAVMVPIAAGLAVCARRETVLYLAAGLVNAAAAFGWFATSIWSGTSGWPVLIDLLNVNAIALALPVPIWLQVHRTLFPRTDNGWPVMVRAGSVPFHRVVARAVLALLAFVVIVGLSEDAAESGGDPNIPIGWSALAAGAVAVGAGLWDERSRGAVAGLYLLGLCASGWGVFQYHLEPRLLAWTGTVVLSAYALTTSYLWNRRAKLRALADQVGIPRPEAENPVAGQAWLVPANLSLAAMVLILAFGMIFTVADTVLRSSAALTAMAQVVAIGLLAQGDRRHRLQEIALGVGVVGAVAWGWAWETPGSPTEMLDRLVVALVALAGASVLYGLGLVKMLPNVTEWTRAAMRLVPGLLGLAGAVLAVVLGVELFDRIEGRDVLMSAPAIVAVAAAMMGAGASALVAALVPGRDPLGLSERGRTAYVYGCEVLLALLVMHFRMTLPWLFSGFFSRYWPLIALGVAYLGVGLGEFFRRQGRLVLAEPLERTGALLPVLPLINGLMTGPRPGEDVFFLVVVGGLYTTLSMLRSSLGFGALAALAYNAALWTVLGRQPGFSIFEHPQLWAISPALCVLAGAYLNRDRLSETQTTTIRYAASLVIYISSTADIVLTGVAQAPWLPLVLAVLSIAGIFAGIALRVRGFLFVGLGFLTLSLFTVIWYAAVDLRQTWIWSASGIVAGILILAVFALFEKKRHEVLRMVDQLKEWQA